MPKACAVGTRAAGQTVQALSRTTPCSSGSPVPSFAEAFRNSVRRAGMVANPKLLGGMQEDPEGRPRDEELSRLLLLPSMVCKRGRTSHDKYLN